MLNILDKLKYELLELWILAKMNDIEKLIKIYYIFLFMHILKVCSSLKKERLLTLWLILMIVKFWIIMILIIYFKNKYRDS